MADLRPGLKDVIAGRTKRCRLLDEKNGKLYYCNLDIENLAGKFPYEAVACLLLKGEMLYSHVLTDFKQRVSGVFSKVEPGVWFKIEEAIKACPKDAHAMELLRQIVSTFSMYDYRRGSQSAEDDHEISIDLIGLMTHFVALVWRYKEGKEPLLTLPKNCGSIPKNLFYLLGKQPSKLETDAMDLLFTLYAEHEFNASTWGGVRIAATVGTDIYSGIINGIGNLKGLLHGGANETAAEFVEGFLSSNSDDIENSILQKVEAVLLKKADWKMPGFGHAVYKSGDVRVPLLKPYVKYLSGEKKDMRYYNVCSAIERAMLRARKIYPPEEFEKFSWWFPNIDFWAVGAYKLMGIPRYLNTPLFAASRIAGWCAHWLESKHELKEKLVRPRAEYIEDPVE